MQAFWTIWVAQEDQHLAQEIFVQVLIEEQVSKTETWVAIYSFQFLIAEVKIKNWKELLEQALQF
jgi:hypothetical protein